MALNKDSCYLRMGGGGGGGSIDIEQKGVEVGHSWPWLWPFGDQGQVQGFAK